MMYTCDISKNLKDGIARLHTEDGKMMLNVYIMIYIINIPVCRFVVMLMLMPPV